MICLIFIPRQSTGVLHCSVTVVSVGPIAPTPTHVGWVTSPLSLDDIRLVLVVVGCTSDCFVVQRNQQSDPDVVFNLICTTIQFRDN